MGLAEGVADLQDVSARRPPRHDQPPDPDDVVRLLEAAAEHDPDIGMLLLVGAVTGARRGELCALRWSDVDS